MGKMRLMGFLGMTLALASACAATAQIVAPVPADKDARAVGGKGGIDVLKGVWVRPDGGYTIAIRSISPAGDLEAMYFNPKELPFMKAQASQEGGAVHAFFALQAGGYAGSTYDLKYDPASDQLRGIYYQAVAKQKFDVYFVRK